MQIQRTILLLLLISFTSLFASDYTLKESKRKRSRIDRMPKHSVADMRNIPQNPSFYASQIKPFSKVKQARLDREYNHKYFKPWHLTRLDSNKKDLGWEVRFVQKEPIYRQNGKRISAKTYTRWIHNANYGKLDTRRYKAITIKRTNVKSLPTNSSFFRDPKKTGEGFPFNYNQNSSLHINVPLYISHYSRDGRWVFVRAAYSFGWLEVSDIAIVNNIFRRKFESGHYAMTIKDNLRLYDEKNRSISIIKLGALFSVAKDKKSYFVAKRNRRGNAIIQRVQVENREKLIAKKPLAFNSTNVAKIAKEFYGEPYGWGGWYKCRDCSATTRDFMGVFGIFLRRNSSKQAKDGHSIRIKGLSKAQKKRKIIRKAQPFRSLLYVPGHIVLYLGQYRGEPVIMHTYWGIRKKNGSKLITGRTIITSTEPGKERRDVQEKSKLINTLKTIVNF